MTEILVVVGYGAGIHEAMALMHALERDARPSLLVTDVVVRRDVPPAFDLTWFEEKAPHYYDLRARRRRERPHHRRQRDLGSVWADRMAERADRKGSSTAA